MTRKIGLLLLLVLLLALASTALAGETAFEPLTVLPPVAPQVSGAPGAPAADGLRWAAVGVAGLAVLVALFQARRRATVKVGVES